MSTEGHEAKAMPYEFCTIGISERAWALGKSRPFQNDSC